MGSQNMTQGKTGNVGRYSSLVETFFCQIFLAGGISKYLRETERAMSDYIGSGSEILAVRFYYWNIFASFYRRSQPG